MLNQLLTDELFNSWVSSLEDTQECANWECCPIKFYLVHENNVSPDKLTVYTKIVRRYNSDYIVEGTSFSEATESGQYQEWPLPVRLKRLMGTVDQFLTDKSKANNTYDLVLNYGWGDLTVPELRQLWGETV